MPDRARLVVMVSGSGTNLQAILDACGQSVPAAGGLDAEVVLVISNDPEAYGLKRASAAGVPATVLPHQGRDRDEYDTELAYEATIVGADLVVLAGWNRVLTHNFLSRHTVINLHPAKPGAFPGLGAIQKAFDAWERGEAESGGVMVHYVPDEGIDSGPVIAWEEVPIVDGDTVESFELRVHQTEHRLLVESIGTVLSERRSAR
jgi:formyltetrahydrofolate-dependent phosphoribosylglycinamide formyltransferase